MGIQINGQTDTITAIDGALTVSGAELPTVTNLNATGIVTATRLNVGTGGTVITTTANGDIGIGIATPGSKLDIANLGTSTSVSTRLMASDSGGNSVRLVTTQNADGSVTFNSNAGGNGSKRDIIYQQQGTEVARLDNSGRLGIGTMNPGYIVDVNGVVNIQGSSGYIRLTNQTQGGLSSDYWIGRGGAGPSGRSLALYGASGNAVELGVGNTSYASIHANALQLQGGTTKILNNDGRPILNQSGSILQVVQTMFQGTFSTSSQTYTNVTGLSASITPSSTSSKILVMCTMHATNSGQFGTYLRITRGGSTISGSLSSSGNDPTTVSAVQASSGNLPQNPSPTYTIVPLRLEYLDSPASTSSQTYQAQTRTGSGGTVYINYQGSGSTNNNNPDFGYYVSSITLIEVSA